jgi:hypothetical protein
MTLTLAPTQRISGLAGTGSAITYTLLGDLINAGVDSFQVIGQGVLGTSASDLYLAPTGVQAIVKQIFLCNVTGSNVTVAMHVNGTANANKIASLTIPANGSATWDGSWSVYDASGFRQSVGATGPSGNPGTPGTNGVNGWSPIFAVVADGERRVLQVTDWTGGTTGKPSTGVYVGVAGFVAPIASAVDIRGAAGAAGTPGTPGTPGEVSTAQLNAAIATRQPADQDLTDIAALTTTVFGRDFLTVVDAPAARTKIGAAPAGNYQTQDADLDAIAALTTTAFGRSQLTLADAAAATAQLSLATTALKGLLSPGDKRIIDSLHYDAVADFGWVGDDSTDNLPMWNAMITALPMGARVFFPAGTYRVSGELNISVDRRITFFGASRYASIIKTTSATANIFHKSVPGWYDAFIDLGFQSSVTKTAGAAIHISAGNNVGMNCYRLWITGVFKGISAIGSQSANLSVWADLDISSIPNGGRGLHIDGDTINIMIHNTTINGGTATTSACCEINRSGAVQVTASDWIMGTNVLLLNANAGAGPQAVYFTNCFFDQPQQSVIKVIGTNTANRLKFTQCGIATGAAGGAAGYHGIEIAGTGVGGVGTATALPAGISIVDCDIYHQAGNGTGAGIRINGAQDVNIVNTRVTGFAGAGGCGIRATPSAGSVTSLRVNGCIIGPNSNLTVTNATGIQLDAGNFARVSISDNGIYGWSVGGIVDNSTTTYTMQKNIADNDGAGLISGTVVARSTTINVANTETEVIGFTAAANVSLKPGLVLRFQASGVQTNTTTTSTSVWRLRIGPVTLTGPVVGSWTVAMGATARTNVPFYVFGQITILSTTTAIATITVLTNGLAYAAPTTTVTAAVTIATNADQRVQLTAISGAASTTWNVFAAEIQAVIP